MCKDKCLAPYMQESLVFYVSVTLIIDVTIQLPQQNTFCQCQGPGLFALCGLRSCERLASHRPQPTKGRSSCEDLWGSINLKVKCFELVHVPERDTLWISPSRRASKDRSGGPYSRATWGRVDGGIMTSERSHVDVWQSTGCYVVRPRESSSRTSPLARPTPDRSLLWGFAVTKARRSGVIHGVSLSGTLYGERKLGVTAPACFQGFYLFLPE